MLPKTFDAQGLLPPQEHVLTLPELRESFLVQGPKEKSPTWDAHWRRQLVDNLERLVTQLWQVGIENIFVDGSFVENKDHPSGHLQRELNLLDPHKIWTWDPGERRLDPLSGKHQLPMWHLYRIELYPHYNQSSGITDRFGNPLLFPSAFRQSRQDYRPRGILKIQKH